VSRQDYIRFMGWFAHFRGGMGEDLTHAHALAHALRGVWAPLGGVGPRGGTAQWNPPPVPFFLQPQDEVRVRE
jgi:hypothetical protein